MSQYLPLLLYLVAVLGFVVVTLCLPHFIAPHKPTRVKNMPYESGMDPEDDARKPLSVQFYLIAILFIVFDVEFLYLYPWAVAIGSTDGIPQGERASVALVVTTLLATMGLAYAYAWRKGVFEWRDK